MSHYQLAGFLARGTELLYRLVRSAHIQNSPREVRWGVSVAGGTMKRKTKPKTKKPGTVEKIIQSPLPHEPEKAEIAVEGADDLYREIRIENTLEDEKGQKVKLKVGAPVEVIVEADLKDTVPKKGK